MATVVAKEGSDISKSFIEAVIRADTQAVQTLLDQGANVDAQDQFGHFTVLMIAINRSHLEIFHILIDAEADVNFQTKHGGTTPLMVASKDAIPGRDAIVNELLARGADPRTLNDDDDTALDIAVSSHVRSVKTFAKIDPEQLPGTVLRDWPIQTNIIYLLTLEKNKIAYLNNNI